MVLRETEDGAIPLPSLLEALKGVIPSFVSRVERPDRGGEWIEYLRERDAAAARWTERLGLDREPGGADSAGGPSVTLLHVLPGGMGPALLPDTDAESEAQRGLSLAAGQLSEHLPASVAVSTTLVYGTPFVEIIRRAREERAELAVVGRHGYRVFADALINPIETTDAMSGVTVRRARARAHGSNAR